MFEYKCMCKQNNRWYNCTHFDVCTSHNIYITVYKLNICLEMCDVSINKLDHILASNTGRENRCELSKLWQALLGHTMD